MPAKPFALSVKVVIHDDDGRCLLLKRSAASAHNAGKWDLPGGKVDTGESFDVALLREVVEETGLTVELETVLGAASSDAPAKVVVYVIMGGRLVAGDVRLSDEHEASIWVPRAELGTVDVCEQFREFARAYGGVDA